MRSGKLIAVNDYYVEQMTQDPDYEIFEDGVILTKISMSGKRFVDPDKRRVAGYSSDEGYRKIKYKGKELRVHRIIYAKFLAGINGNPPLEDDLIINHKDSNPNNNAVSNLELVTQSENNRHSFRNGRAISRGNTKLSLGWANQIRDDYKSGMSYNDLVEKHKISKGSISSIINNRSWV